jgi:preprotein translocase subunit SecF
MTENQKKWINEYVQWKALIILISISIAVFGTVYSLATRAVEMGQDNKSKIDVVTERQNNQYKEIKESLERIEKNLDKK